MKPGALPPHLKLQRQETGCGVEPVANGQQFNPRYVCNEVSMKTQKNEVWRPWKGWEKGVLERAWKLRVPSSTLPEKALPSGYSLVVSFYNKLGIP